MKRFNSVLISTLLVFTIAPLATATVDTPFNGKDLSGWKFKKPADKSKWTVGVAEISKDNPKLLTVNKGTGDLINNLPVAKHRQSVDIYSEYTHGDAVIDLEVMVPKGANSGIYVHGEYEIQVLDSYGKDKAPGPGDMGAVYGAQPPTKPLYKKPGQWSTYHIEFRAPRFDVSGKKTANARFVKIVLNGRAIHENLELKGPTPSGVTGKEHARGPIMFQGDHGPVAYRNIRITPIDDKCESKDKNTLRVSTFQSDVTIPMGQILYSHPVKTIEHPLMAKGIVVEDGNTRYVLCAVDWCTMRNLTHDMYRQKLADAVGTDVSNVVVQCVHQHTAPSHDGSAQVILNKHKNPPKFRDLKFLDEVTTRLAAAAKASLSKMREVDRIGTGQAKVDRVASSRRIMVGDKLHGRMSSTKNPKLQALPEGFIDPWLKTITLAKGDKPVVRLHYYATHPQSFYRDGRTSWDVPGIARQRLEEKEGIFQIYFTGCAGDVAMGKYNNGTREARAALAERLYQGMAASAASTKLVPLGKLTWRTVEVQLPSKTDDKHDKAKNLAIVADTKVKDYDRVRAASRVACAERLAKPIKLCSLEIGDIHIVHLPGEPMLEFQMYAQKTLPEKFVAVAGYGLGTPCYICTEESFKQGGYEPGASAVQPKSEGILKTAIRGMLGVE
ncbi:MAG: DUF1080 domain-containing protein [Pirellulales bacterium]|nr:DUF1080 domain-containing protein [Pirellulales bacterium]